MLSAKRVAGLRNVIGSSPSVIQKMSNEAKVKLWRDEELDQSFH
jgi:hypothetical protein